jgi:glycosyltransferase involved in cell wall biosynthesis
MPLPDTPWERGKCGFKLVQYMAAGLPVVASPVGVNATLVTDQVEGFLASSTEEWVASLTSLRDSPGLRASLGTAGRSKVERELCLQVTAPRLHRFLEAAAARG